MRENPIFLIDMDSITVDMATPWLKTYYERTGDRILLSNCKNWSFSSAAKYPKKLNAIYQEDGFFANLPPMPGSPEYIRKLMEKGVDIVFLTQLPRKSRTAANDKKEWIEKHIPKFDTRNVIFAHRKHIVCGDLLFDDNPIHLWMWRQFHNKRMQFPLEATIKYTYNKDTQVDWMFKVKSRAWKDFYERSVDYYNLK